MENNDIELGVLSFVYDPKNIEIKDFLLAAQRYHTQNELEKLFPIQILVRQLSDWVKYLCEPLAGVDMHSAIINSKLIGLRFNDFEKYVIFDILSPYIELINSKNLGFFRSERALQQFSDEKNKIALSIKNYSLEKIKSLLDSLAGSSNSKQMAVLSIYKRLYFRMLNIDQRTKTDFTTLVDLQITLLQQSPNNDPSFILSEAINKLRQEKQETKIDDKKKLFIPDVAEILRCSISQVRRLIVHKSNRLQSYRDTPRGKIYFFIADINDWQANNKQKSSFEEAGEVFTRKPKGNVKKRRPPLG